MTLLQYCQEGNNKSSLPTHKLAYMTSRLQAIEPRSVTIQKTTIRTYHPKAHYIHWLLQVHGCCWFSSKIYSRKKYSHTSRLKLIYPAIFFHFSLRNFLNIILANLTYCKRACVLHEHMYHRKFINFALANDKWTERQLCVGPRAYRHFGAHFSVKYVGLPLFSFMCR
jgi:hypothetical protein